MAIALELIDLVVPISRIRALYPGGWEQCLKDHEDLIGGRVWYDEHLLRDGAMDGRAMHGLVDHWTHLGFEPFLDVDGKRVWNDMCVVETMMMGTTLPCSWLVVDLEHFSGHLAGTEPGAIIGGRRDGRYSR